jgi:two-component system, NarL family, response regulator DevR
MQHTSTPTNDDAAVRTISVVIVDDHDVVRAGLRAVFEALDDVEVAGEAGSVDEARRLLLRVRPDVALIDLQLPDGSGAEVCSHVMAELPNTRTLILTSFAHREAVDAAIDSGAAGYVLKQVQTGELVDCVRRVAAGESLSGRRPTARREVVDPRYATLSSQERILLGHLAAGLTNREIAAEMHLADNTVKNYVSRLLAKVGATRRSGAAAFAASVETRRQRAGVPEAPPQDGPILY